MSNVSKQGRARAPVIARVPASSDSVVSHGRRGRQPRSAAMPGAAGGDASNAGGGRGGEDAYVPVAGRAGRGRRSFMLGPQSNEDAAPASSFAAPSQNKAKSLPVLTTSRTSWEVANTLLGRRASPRVDLDFQQQQQQQRSVLSLEEELADEEEIQVRERCASFSRVPNLHGTSKETTLSKAITSSGVRQQPARSPSPTQAQAPALGAGDYDPSMGRGRPGRLQTTWEKLLLRQCLLNKVDLVEKTIDSGKIGPNFEFFNGETALIIACKRGYKKLAQAVMHRGANMDFRDSDGNTAAHWAFKMGFNDLANLLLANGANDRIVNNQGYTCRNWGLTLEEDSPEEEDSPDPPSPTTAKDDVIMTPGTTQSVSAGMESMSSPESFIQFKFTSPTFERKLQSTETEGYDIRTVIENLLSNVKMGYLPDESEAFRKTNVVIMGLTGAGKSTLVNCLAGCEMEQVDPKEARVRKIPQTSIRVRPQANGGTRDSVAVIGLSGSKSETRVLQHITIPGQEFVVWDAPGFEDSSGPEVSIANAVNLTRLLKVSQVKGLVIGVLLDANALQVGRGTLVKLTLDTLISLFGSKQSRLSDHASSILFIVTKVPPDDQFSHDTIRETVEEQAREQGVHVDINKQILLFDPLKKYQNTDDAQDIIKSILSAKAIIGSQNLFNVSLSSRDDQLLRKIADVASDYILRHMDSGQYDEVKRQLDLLGILEIIDHQVITRTKVKAQDSIIHSAQQWMSILNENASNYSPQGRATLRHYLKRFEEARCLDIVLEISQFQKGYERATDLIKREESNYQKRENEGLQIELNELLQSKNSMQSGSHSYGTSFRSDLQEFCDSNPDVVEQISLRRNCTLDYLLSVLLGENLPSLELFSHKRSFEMREKERQTDRKGESFIRNKTPAAEPSLRSPVRYLRPSLRSPFDDGRPASPSLPSKLSRDTWEKTQEELEQLQYHVGAKATPSARQSAAAPAQPSATTGMGAHSGAHADVEDYCVPTLPPTEDDPGRRLAPTFGSDDPLADFSSQQVNVSGGNMGLGSDVNGTELEEDSGQGPDTSNDEAMARSLAGATRRADGGRRLREGLGIGLERVRQALVPAWLYPQLPSSAGSAQARAGGGAVKRPPVFQVDGGVGENGNDVGAQEVVLPSGWEKKVDQSGNVFYSDHNTRTTHWDPPKCTLDSGTSNSPVPSDTARAMSSHPVKPEMENISRFTRDEMKNTWDAVASDWVPPAETLVCHYTDVKSAELIMQPSSPGFRASTVGQGGGGFYVVVVPPHEMEWEKNQGGAFRAIVGRELWGEKASNVLLGGCDAHKLDVVFLIKVPRKWIEGGRGVPGRPAIRIIPLSFLYQHQDGFFYLQKQKIVKCYVLKGLEQHGTVQNSRPVGFQKIACFFEKIDRLIALREPGVKFIYGDQHDLKMLKTECAAKVVDITMQVILQARISQLDSNFLSLKEKLEAEIPKVVEDHYDCLYQTPITSSDLTGMTQQGRAVFSDALLKEVKSLFLVLKAYDKQLYTEKSHILDQVLMNLRRSASLAVERRNNALENEALSTIAKGLALTNLASDQIQNSLVEALTTLKHIKSGTFEQQVALIQEKLASMQNEEAVGRLFAESRDTELTTLYQTLTSLQGRIKDHFKVDVEPISKAVIKQFSDLECRVREELARHPMDPQYLELKSTARFGAAATHFSSVFPQFQHSKSKLTGLAEKNVNRELKPAAITSWATQGDVSLSRIVVKNWGVSQELGFSSIFGNYMRKNIFKQLQPQELRLLGDHLKDMQLDTSERALESSKLAAEVISNFPEFTSFARELFNSKAGAVTFDMALKHPSFKTKGETLDQNALSKVYSVFDSTYETYINKMCQSIKEYPEKEVQGEIHRLSQSLKTSRSSLKKKGDEFGTLLGLVCAQWSYLTAENEGSTDMKRTNVKQAHGTQILGILSLLGLGSSKLFDRLIQIGTGEGKSVALGLTSVLLALFGFSVDVVCYSRYLSERDWEEFEPLFRNLGVHNRIHYYDFNQLTTAMMRAGTNMPNARDAFESFMKKTSLCAKYSERNESVLLLDEVDIFFDEHFYGGAYRPVVSLNDTNALVKRVWESRAELTSIDKVTALKKILAFKQTQDILSTYPNLALTRSEAGESFIEHEIQKMLDDLPSFDHSGRPSRRSVPNAIFDEKQKTIGYIDSLSGVPSFSTTYSYYTAFTYMYYADQKRLKESDLTDHKIGLNMRCGTLSYAEIPTSYKYKFGMSGTLNCLTSHQNDVLKRYGFKISTELPSTYKKRNLLRKPIEVLDQGKDKFFDKICDAAREKSEEGMAVLVFLQDEERLQELKKYIKDQGKTITPLELSDSLTKAEREQHIRWSTQNKKITFVTRAYGRGTDFVCHDARAKQFGGVHLIMTFYPNDDSENRQLEGRTCRQDDPGSVQKLVWLGDLKHLGSDRPDFKPGADQDWDDFLRQKRDVVLESRFKLMFKKKKRFGDKHKQTVKACQMVADFECAPSGNSKALRTMLRIAYLFSDASVEPTIDDDEEDGDDEDSDDDEDDSDDEAADARGPELFYHGTSLEAAMSIQKVGFDVQRSGSNAGAALGRGLYVTTTMEKAVNYAKRMPCQGAIFEVQVQLGRCYKVTSDNDNNKAKWQEMGYDSAWAAAGIIGEHEENCIKDPRPPRVIIQNVILGHTGEAKRLGYSVVNGKLTKQ